MSVRVYVHNMLSSYCDDGVYWFGINYVYSYGGYTDKAHTKINVHPTVYKE